MEYIVDKSKYYKYVYNRLVLQHISCNSQQVGLYKKVVLDKELKNLLDEIYRQYHWNFYENARANIVKFRLWRKEFNLPENEMLVYAATYFVLYCCMVDKILDSRQFSQDEKKVICKGLETFWENSSRKMCLFPQVDLLGERTKQLLFKAGIKSDIKASYLHNKISRAFSSEIFLFNHPLDCFSTIIQLQDLTDKSVEFVSGAFCIAAYDCTDCKMETISTSIGSIFWLIDDICDFAADLEDGNINSVLVLCTDMSQEMTIKQRIDQAFTNMEFIIQRLETEVEKLKSCVSKEFFDWILNALWMWTGDVRKAVVSIELK